MNGIEISVTAKSIGSTFHAMMNQEEVNTFESHHVVDAIEKVINANTLVFNSQLYFVQFIQAIREITCFRLNGCARI